MAKTTPPVARKRRPPSAPPTLKEVVSAKLETLGIFGFGLLLIPLTPLVWVAIVWLRARHSLHKLGQWRHRRRQTRREAAEKE